MWSRSTAAVGRSRRGHRPDGRTRTRCTPAIRWRRADRLPELNDGVARLRRRVPRLGLPRGRLPLRRRGRREAGCDLVMTCPAVRRRDTARPGRTGAARRAQPQLPVVRGPGRAAAAARPFGWLAGSEARDSLGDPALSIRENVDAFLAEHGIDLRGGRITMLANPRSLGYVVQPAQRCSGATTRRRARCASSPRCTTRTAQATATCSAPTTPGGAETEKQFYVSPFYPVDGYYRMSVPEPGERLAITITLHRPGARPFTASVRGRAPAGDAARRRSAPRCGDPFETWLVRGLITGTALPSGARVCRCSHVQPTRPPRSPP